MDNEVTLRVVMGTLNFEHTTIGEVIQPAKHAGVRIHREFKGGKLPDGWRVDDSPVEYPSWDAAAQSLLD
jgi:hypothetical protein